MLTRFAGMLSMTGKRRNDQHDRLSILIRKQFYALKDEISKHGDAQRTLMDDIIIYGLIFIGFVKMFYCIFNCF
jgi:hypothetical protein